MRIYNTLTRTKQEFIPLAPGKVKMYVCGPTVYDYCHLGHGRAYVAFDIICRYLKYKGYDVTYARNITDIDDKIIARANEMDLPGAELKEKVSVLTKKYLDEFNTDMESLGLVLPKYEPKATEYIPHMIELVEKLIEKGLAYVAGGNVYYEVSKFSDYGKLSGRSLDELLAGVRVEPGPGKRAPLDFSLWKEAKPQEPWWDSPWGKGRPGWHIECSSMGLSLLGEVFDIHGGGQDLIFPHHENEIAQSCGCTGKQPVRYWIHNGFVTINKEKMSKSLGNFFTLKDIFKKYHPRVVRFFLLSQHYRSPVDFSDRLLEDSKNALERIEDCFRRVQICLDYREDYNIDEFISRSIKDKFEEAMDDDFNTARALAVVFDTVKELNNISTAEPKDKVYTKFHILGKLIYEVLGISYGIASTMRVYKELILTESELQERMSGKLDRKTRHELIAARLYYRRMRKWALADRIRKYIEDKGYVLNDKKNGTDCI